jgi:glycerol uptake facilitator-like aquaporin
VVLDFGTGSPVARVLPSHSLRLLLTGALFASCGALVTISPLGRRSGAHLNPAVTLAFWCRRHLRTGDLIGYVASQAAGAVAGAFAVRLLWGRRSASVSDGRTQPGHGLSPLGAAGLEAVMGEFADSWVYVAGPLSGALVAAGIWALVPLETLTAKLFHDERYRSVFASELPAKT